MKKLSIVLAVAVLASLLVIPVASADGITWTSGFQVQNLGTSQAAVTIQYFNQDGTEAIASIPDTIDSMSSKTYYPIHAPDGFNGSVVVSSNQPVVAIANTLGDSPQYAASTEGFSAGAQPVMLPLIMKGNYGYYTWFNVQNVGTTAASVTVEYIPGSDGTPYTAPAVTIEPNAAHTFNQRDLTQLGTLFIGSAVVTSSQPIVASVMQVGETFKNLMGYNGFAAGSTTVSLPLIMAKNYDYYTGIQVQNVGSATATVTINYGANAAGGFAPVADSVSLAPNESATFLQTGGQWTDIYVGSATITSSQPVVAIVNQVKMVGTVVGTAYNGFDPDTATNKVSAPLIMANNYGYYTGMQVMNVGASATAVTVTYGPNAAGGFAPAAESTTINPGDSYTWIQNGGAWTGNKYVGSVIVEAAAGAKLVMIVNQTCPTAAGDQFMTYDGFNY